MKQTFEDFLREIHIKNYTGTADDAPDSFDSFCEGLGWEELMQMGLEYGDKMYKLGVSDSLKKLDEVQLDLQEAKEANINH